jgi:hypothetical protein
MQAHGENVYTLERNGILPNEKYFFRRNRSTADVHIILESEIQEAFRLKQHFLIASLDMEKAYDTC